MQQVASNFDAK